MAMILAVDIGNSNITVGGIQGKVIRFQARLRTETTKTSDEYAIDLKMLLDIHGIHPAEIEGSIIASVVPQVLNSMKTALKKLLGKNSLVIGPGLKTGLNIRIDNPAQTGADLVVGCVAALRLYQPPLIVIDMGTATTITAVGRNSTYLGGCICPGVRISLDALISRTAQLPGISLGSPQKVIGHNTIDCMQSGVMIGAAAMLDGMVERMEQEMGEPCKTVITGGISRFILPYCHRKMTYDKDLLLKGLMQLYYNNRPK